MRKVQEIKDVKKGSIYYRGSSCHINMVVENVFDNKKGGIDLLTGDLFYPMKDSCQVVVLADSLDNYLRESEED